MIGDLLLAVFTAGILGFCLFSGIYLVAEAQWQVRRRAARRRMGPVTMFDLRRGRCH